MTDKKGFDHTPGSWRRRALAVLASALIIAAAGCVAIPTPTPTPTSSPMPTPTPSPTPERMAIRVIGAATTEFLSEMLSEGWEVERVDRTYENFLIYVLRRVSTASRR